MRKFPSIGRPAADRIALLAGWRLAASVDSNSLRVLTRVGYVDEARSYRPTYASAVRVLVRSFRGRRALVRAYELLRRHGKGLCRRTMPRCELCPLRPSCRYAQARAPTTGLD